MIATIYSLSDPETNEVRYIGVTTRTPWSRLQEHIKEAKTKKQTHKLNWIRQLLTNNKKPYLNTLLTLESDDLEIIYQKEQEVIKLYKEMGFKLVNGTDGGLGSLGHVLSKEIKNLLAKKAKEQWLRYSEETKQRLNVAMSKRLLGNNFRTGKKDPPSRLLSKSAEMKGKNSPSWNGYIVQMDDNFNEINRWESIGDAAKHMKLGYKMLWTATWKKTKKGIPYKAGGYNWKYDKNER